jgi:hypothetical protein
VLELALEYNTLLDPVANCMFSSVTRVLRYLPGLENRSAMVTTFGVIVLGKGPRTMYVLTNDEGIPVVLPVASML